MTKEIKRLFILVILVFMVIIVILINPDKKIRQEKYSLNEVLNIISETEFIYVCSGDKLKENDVCEEDKTKMIIDRVVIQDILSFVLDSEYYEDTVGNNAIEGDRYILYFMKDDNKIAELFYNKYMVLKKGISSFFLKNENFKEIENLIN